MEDLEKTLESLEEERGRLVLILSDLNNSHGFKYLLEDMQKAKQEMDDKWHLVSPDQVAPNGMRILDEMRITKLAIATVIGTIQTYEERLAKIKDHIEKITNPADFIHKDYDSE